MNNSIPNIFTLPSQASADRSKLDEEQRGTEIPSNLQGEVVHKEIPFLNDLTQVEREQFFKLNPPLVSYNAKDFIIRHGEHHRILYLLLKGSVAVTHPEHSGVLARLQPGEFFGEMSFLTQTPRHTHVIAEERTMVIKITHEMFKALPPAVQNKIRDQIIQLLVKRLDTMNMAMLKISEFANAYALRDCG